MRRDITLHGGDFVATGDIIADAVGGKWDNPSGAFNIALKEKLTVLSVADNWQEAREEWKATGKVWYVPMKDDATEVLPEPHKSSHAHFCICGHPIAWHFEIENTENGRIEIVGSEHIGFWMVARHLIENLNIPIDMITQERVKQWTDEAVASMKAKWWWKQHGEQFEEWFEAVSETDLRVNIRNGDSYWDEDTSRYEHQPLIRKKSSNAYGTSDYQMASILWRWNHPDNKKWFYYHDKTGKRIKKTTYDDLMWDDKRNYTRGATTESTAQKNTRGWPNDRLWNDLMIFYFDLDNQKAKLAARDAERIERLAYVVKEKEEQNTRRLQEQKEYEAREAIRREKRRLAQEEHQIKLDGAFEKFCEANDLPIFNSEYGSNNWEQTFLSDMIRKINNLNPMSTKQKERVIKIINRVSEPATEKQLAYIRSLGGEPSKDMTKKDASEAIEELKNPPKSESETGEEE